MDTPLPLATQQRRKRLTTLMAAALITALCASAWATYHLLRPTISAADVRIADVRRGDIANTISAAGVVVPLPRNW